MQDVVIVGGGFAGVWSALSAAELRRCADATDLRVRLVNPRDDLVIRPRLYEADPSAMTVPLSSILDPIGVEHVRASVDGIDAHNRRMTIVDAEGGVATIHYDRLILATGSYLVAPPMDRANIHDIDTVEAAVALEDHLLSLGGMGRDAGAFTAVVVGCGFTGIELAAELVGRIGQIAEAVGHAHDVRVVMVEREAVVGPELGPGPRPVILDAFAQLGVELRLNTTLVDFDGQSAQFDDGSSVAAVTVVWTANQRASDLTSEVGGTLDHLGRLRVDQQLRVENVPAMFAAGDTAAPLDSTGHVVVQSCQHAEPQGSCAGHNAVADLLRLPLLDLDIAPYRTCVDLGTAGAVFTTGWDREVELTGSEAKARKRLINSKLIYPPVGDEQGAGQDPGR